MMALREACDELLLQSYDAADGDLSAHLNVWQMAERLGWDRDVAQRAATRLVEKGYLHWTGIGGMYGLTRAGVDAVETVRPALDKALDRVAFLAKTYESTHGDPSQWVNMWDLGEALGWDRRRTARVFEYLSAHGLVKGWAIGGTFGITEAAVDIWEEATARPESPTAYFPPLASLNIDLSGATVAGAAIGSPGATVQTGNITVVHSSRSDEVLEALDSLQRAIMAADIADGERAASTRDIESLKEEHGKPHPNPTVLRGVWNALRARIGPLLEATAQSAAKATVETWIKGM